MRITFNFLATIIVIVLSGCVGAIVDLPGEKLPLHTELAPIPEMPLCRIAVLPFLNMSEAPRAEVTATKAFMAILQSAANFTVVQEGDVNDLYRQLRILPGEKPSFEQLKILSDRLDTRFFIKGIVREAREERDVNNVLVPSLTIEVQIYDPVNNLTLWTTYHKRKGTDYLQIMHFGTIHTVTGLCRQMAEEIINLWFEKGLPTCSVLS